MIYRIASDGLSLTVENEEGVMFTLSTAHHAHAHQLARKAQREGVEAIRPVDEPAKKKATKK